MSWEEYYSTLQRFPQKWKKPVPFLVNELNQLKSHGVRSVLDLGCGAGRNLICLAEKGFDVVGVDSSKSALKFADLWIRRQRLENVFLVEGTMTNLPFDDDLFDAVVSISVIHHGLKKDIAKAILEVHRVLRKNGLFFANLASVNDPRFGEGKKVEDNTFKIWEAFEDEQFEELHHFFTQEEALSLLACFVSSEVTPLRERPNYWKTIAFK